MVPDTSRSAGTLSMGHCAWPGIALSSLTALSGAVWGSLLAILILLISPVLQNYWGLGPEEPPPERLTYFKTMLAISGLLAVRWLRGRVRRP
jgi:hypothetical protein